MILEQERATYEEAWAIADYAAHSPGEKYAPVFADMVQHHHLSGSLVLDAGCGAGKGAQALSRLGYAVHLCDLTPAGLSDEVKDFPFSEACLWKPLRSQVPYILGGDYDFTYCCDVLEHLPESLTMLAIARMLEMSTHLFLTVSTVQDSFGAWVGKSLHQTVKPFTWWRDQLNAVGTVIEGRDLLVSAAFLVRE